MRWTAQRSMGEGVAPHFTLYTRNRTNKDLDKMKGNFPEFLRFSMA